MIDEMKKAIFSRYNKHGIKFDTWEELKQKTGLTEEQELLCYYCGDKLLATDIYPYRKVVSLDHKVPKCKGGNNSIENTCLCCTECNIIKGTMEDYVFFTFLEIMNHYPIEKKLIFDEMFWGKRKNKIERQKKETKQLWELV